MKHTLFIFALLTASIQTFAQSPRIKLNQITKDSVTGSVLISSPTDSGMVYSRDLFISYGADTVLILGEDTLAATSSIISSVLSDGVTITGDGTIGSELTADTSVLATLRALSDSLALVISSVTSDGVTITGDGTVGSPLTVDTATVVSSVGRLLDSLINVRTDLNLKQDQLNGTGFVKATGTTISYDNSTYLTSEVDGDASNELQTLSYNSSTNEITLSDGGGTEDLSNLDLVDSTRINATGDTAYYYQNGTLIGTGAIAGGGGGSGTVTSVDVSGGSTGLTTSGGPITTSGTITLAGTLNVANGGTGATSFTSNQMLKGNGTSGIQAASYLRENGDTTVVDNIFNVKKTTGSATIAIFEQSVGTGLIRIDGKTGGGRIDIYQNNVLRGIFGVSGGLLGDASTDVGFFSEEDIIYIAGGSGVDMKIENDGDVVIPEAYSELISGTTRDLYIKNDGTLGYIPSTIKSKTNVNPLNNIDFIYNLNPVTFNYRKQDEQGGFTDEFYDKISYGLIAEEVESVADYMVYYDETENGKIAVGINYSELITPLLKAVQNQKTEIETLKTLITELNNRLTILENK